MRVEQVTTLRLFKDEPLKILIVGENKQIAGSVGIDEINPIPITPELMLELGFEEIERNEPKSSTAKATMGVIPLPKIYEKRIENTLLRMVGTNEKWRIQAYMDGYVVIFGSVESLHELEMLVYQAINFELLND